MKAVRMYRKICMLEIWRATSRLHVICKEQVAFVLSDEQQVASVLTVCYETIAVIPMFFKQLW